MTAPELPDADPLDEVASAVFDGEATAAEQARADDADVAARVVTFAAVAAQLRQPVTVDRARRESAIAAAMAAAGPGDVVVLRRRRPPRWLPAAAAVAAGVALLGGAVLAAVGSDDRPEEAATATASDDSGAERLEAADGAAAGEAGGSELSATTSAGGAIAASPAPAPESAGSSVTDLGDVTGAEDLAIAVRSLLPPDDSSPRDADDVQAEAMPTPCADRFGASLVAVATARVDGMPVTIGVFADDAGRSYVALDQADCQRQIAAGSL